MSEKHYAPGDVIYQEGDPSDTVCLIRTGQVEVVKEIGEWPIVLGTIGAGEYVGEMGVIERQPRGATVRAETEVEAVILDEEEFLRRISEDNSTALAIIQRLSERLRSANQLVAEIETAAASVSLDTGEPASVVSRRDPTSAPAAPSGSDSVLDRHLPAITRTLALLPASEATEEALTVAGLILDELPFYVGRTPAKGERTPACELGLALEDSEPFRLSRVHFSIVRIRDGFMVSDASSTLGTLVNGEFIGQHAAKVFSVLQPGENLILAGGTDSPFQFRAVVSEG